MYIRTIPDNSLFIHVLICSDVLSDNLVLHIFLFCYSLLHCDRRWDFLSDCLVEKYSDILTYLV